MRDPLQKDRPKQLFYGIGDKSTTISPNFIGFVKMNCYTVYNQQQTNNVTVSVFYMTFPISTVKGSDKITDVQYSVSGSTLYITVIGQNISFDGTLTFGWRVYTNEGAKTLQSEDHTTDMLNPGQFSHTFTVENVTSSSHKSYQVFIGAPLIN